MSEDNELCVKARILELLWDLDDVEIDSVKKWMITTQFNEDLQRKRLLQDTDNLLVSIGNAIKKLVPFEAELPSENIVPPSVGDQADCNSVNTYHVDEFLYDHNEVEKLAKKGKIKRHYCLDCNSRNIEELIFISHSSSRHILQYIFNVLLPKDMSGKQILDVGSRMGAVVYGAYHYSNAARIVGVEMNKEFCEIQENIIEQFSMDRTRIKVVNSDITERSDIAANSDVIVISVLDFFVDIEKHKEMWYFFKKNIKRGSYVVLNRSIADTLSSLDIYEEFMDWLDICKPNQIENEIFFDIEDCNEIYLYTAS